MKMLAITPLQREKTDGIDERVFAGVPSAHASIVEKSALVEAPGSTVVQVEVAISTEVLAGKELAVCAGDKTRKLLIRELFELIGGDRRTNPESWRFHGSDSVQWSALLRWLTSRLSRARPPASAAATS
jgi:hypothetical protein